MINNRKLYLLSQKPFRETSGTSWRTSRYRRTVENRVVLCSDRRQSEENPNPWQKSIKLQIISHFFPTKCVYHRIPRKGWRDPTNTCITIRRSIQSIDEARKARDNSVLAMKSLLIVSQDIRSVTIKVMTSAAITIAPDQNTNIRIFVCLCQKERSVWAQPSVI